MTTYSPRAPSARSIVYRYEVEIAGSAARVWETLAELPGYADWNPWLVRAEGDLSPGGIVWADVMLGGNRRRVKHVVLDVAPRARLVWRDAGWNAFFVYGQRARTLTPI